MTSLLLILLGAALLFLLAAGATWLAYQTFAQNGRILLRLEQVEEEIRAVRDALEEAAEAGDEYDDGPGAPLAGLEAGTVVPDFELATVDGGTLTLWEWKGREVLLVFFDPDCDFSAELFERAKVLRPGDGSPVTLLIGTGEPGRNAEFVRAYGLDFPVLVQEEREVARVLHADGTPAAYRIDESGRTVGERALGVSAVLDLLRHGLFGPAEDPEIELHPALEDYTALNLPAIPTRTRIRRSGLRPGEAAPGFRLPGVDGVERSLADFAGRPLLLVFSDAHCRPCQELMPALERVGRELDGTVQLLAISRGGRDANLVHARDVNFPVLLQRRWEVSRDYAMFATPIAYLIDEDGTIASRPALGGKAILELVDEARRRADAATAPA